mgnify:CR=1 FL=1
MFVDDTGKKFGVNCRNIIYIRKVPHKVNVYEVGVAGKTAQKAYHAKMSKGLPEFFGQLN